MRGCYKRIREREEAFDELRRRSRNTGAKEETAEKKLAKMGVENKALPGQTELLERLRADIRQVSGKVGMGLRIGADGGQLDTEITAEESKICDFKRQ